MPRVVRLMMPVGRAGHTAQRVPTLRTGPSEGLASNGRADYRFRISLAVGVRLVRRHLDAAVFVPSGRATLGIAIVGLGGRHDRFAVRAPASGAIGSPRARWSVPEQTQW
jgi:hypothetical protein